MKKTSNYLLWIAKVIFSVGCCLLDNFTALSLSYIGIILVLDAERVVKGSLGVCQVVSLVNILQRRNFTETVYLKNGTKF